MCVPQDLLISWRTLFCEADDKQNRLDKSVHAKRHRLQLVGLRFKNFTSALEVRGTGHKWMEVLGRELCLAVEWCRLKMLMMMILMMMITLQGKIFKPSLSFIILWLYTVGIQTHQLTNAESNNIPRNHVAINASSPTILSCTSFPDPCWEQSWFSSLVRVSRRCFQWRDLRKVRNVKTLHPLNAMGSFVLLAPVILGCSIHKEDYLKIPAPHTRSVG